MSTEILHESGKFGDLLKKVIAEKIIEHYHKAVISRMCDGEKGLTVGHTRRGTGDTRGEEKNYIGQGWRKNPRGVMTDFGDIVFKVRNVRCRSCGKIFAPIIGVLETGSRERKADGLQLKITDMISKQS
jgi:hypothetical protein